MARELHLIVVGKLKDAHLEAVEADYLKRITNPSLIIHEVKASAENKEAEAEAILKKARELNFTHLMVMSEWGKKRTSVEFAEWTKDLIEKQNRPVFAIAGAFVMESASPRRCRFAPGARPPAVSPAPDRKWRGWRRRAARH